MTLRNILISTVFAALLVGCASNSIDADAKRAQDRTAMRLAQSERERDDYKSQSQKLQSELDDLRKASDDSSQQVALLKKQVLDLQNTNTSLSTEIDKLKTDLTRAAAAKSAEGK